MQYTQNTMKIFKIGRNQDNDIVINDESRTVSGFHAELIVDTNGILKIIDYSTNGTYVNGAKAIKGDEVSIQKDDEIRFGPYYLFDISKVVLFSKDDTMIENRYVERFTIGTAADNRIVIADTTNYISRYHAIVTLDSTGMYYIKDISTNGTYVNGVKIKSKVEKIVTSNDNISFANEKSLDWSLIVSSEKATSSPKNMQPHIPSQTPNASSSYPTAKKSTTSKIIGWGLISVGVLTLISGGVSFSFEGICAVSVPFIGGIILLKRG